MGELSRLYQKLFYGSSLATDVSGGLYVPHDPGMLYFQVEVDSVEKVTQAAKQILEEILRLQKEGPTEEELERVIVNSESERLYSTQTADGMAGRLGFLKFVVGDMQFDEGYLEELRSVDARKIQEVAAKYFDPRRMSGALLLPKGVQYDLKEIAELGKKMLEPQVEETSVKTKKGSTKKEVFPGPRPEVITLSNGMKVIYRERAQSHVMSIHSATLGGMRLELSDPVESAQKDWGASNLMAMTWTKGTPDKDARKIASIVEGSAANLDGFSGRHTVGVQTTGLARDWKVLSELFNETLFHPTFPTSELEHSKRVVEESIRSIEDHSAQLASKLFLETLFEKHPYGHLTAGSLESVRSIDSAKLKAFHQRWVKPSNLTLTVVGAVKRRDLDHWLKDLEKQTNRGPTENLLNKKVDEETALKAPRWTEKSLGREQLHIIVGGLGIRLTDPERYTLRILQNILGGQSGRLFIELREKKSLGYTVAPISFEGMERGYVGTYIACSPSKRQEAIDGIKTVLEVLAKKGPTPAEMARAKEFYLGRRAMDLQSDSSLASYYGLEAVYNLPYLTEEEIVRRISAVKPKDVQDFCRKFLVEPHMVTTVVG